MAYYQKVTVIYRCQEGDRKVEIIRSYEEGMDNPMIPSSEQALLLQSSSSDNRNSSDSNWWNNEKKDGWW